MKWQSHQQKQELRRWLKNDKKNTLEHKYRRYSMSNDNRTLRYALRNKWVDEVNHIRYDWRNSWHNNPNR